MAGMCSGVMRAVFGRGELKRRCHFEDLCVGLKIAIERMLKDVG